MLAQPRRWNATGDALIIAHTNETFAKELLPSLFRHSNTSSLLRQLNLCVHLDRSQR